MWLSVFLIAILAIPVFEGSIEYEFCINDYPIEDELSPVISDYYWRDYAGYMPSDALPGGQEYNGLPIYIGQVYKDNRLVPGKIYTWDNKIHFTFGFAYQTQADHVKILCTQNPQKFSWINTTVLNLNKTLGLVLAGRDGDYYQYVGRAQYQTETGIGRVAIHITDINNGYNGIYLSYNNKVISYKSFEVLTYLPID